jgi:hypothetical protein
LVQKIGPVSPKYGKPLLDSKGQKISLHVAVEQNLLELCRTSKDPKILSGAAKLLDILFTRAHGRAKDSPVNRDALVQSEITTVFVAFPAGVPKAEEKSVIKPVAPSWVVSTDKSQGKDVITDAEHSE